MDVIEEKFNSGKKAIVLKEWRSLGIRFDFQDIAKFIIQDVSLLLSRIAEKSDRLIVNVTTNVAESWMHIRCKFDGGKMHNLCNRASWHAQCYGGALLMIGPQLFGRNPRLHSLDPSTQKYSEDRKLSLKIVVSSRGSHRQRRAGFLKKVQKLKQSTTAKTKKCYGEDSMKYTDDVSEQLKRGIHCQNLNISPTQISQIQALTVQQSSCGLWHSERHKRLTASNFGKVFPSIPVKQLVQSFLYSNFKGNRHTKNGLLKERSTTEGYKLQMFV